jgi:hypothetical protein
LPQKKGQKKIFIFLYHALLVCCSSIASTNMWFIIYAHYIIVLFNVSRSMELANDF